MNGARSQIDEFVFPVVIVDNADNVDKNRRVLFGWFFCRLQTVYVQVDNVDNS